MNRDEFQKFYIKAWSYATDKVGSDPRCWMDILADKFCELQSKKMTSIEKFAEKHGLEKKVPENVQVLLDALEKIADPRKRDHKEPDTYTELGCIMNIADQALAKFKELNNEKST